VAEQSLTVVLRIFAGHMQGVFADVINAWSARRFVLEVDLSVRNCASVPTSSPVD
jgi:hypothetical protein